MALDNLYSSYWYYIVQLDENTRIGSFCYKDDLPHILGHKQLRQTQTDKNQQTTQILQWLQRIEEGPATRMSG